MLNCNTSHTLKINALDILDGHPVHLLKYDTIHMLNYNIMHVLI